MWWFFTLLIVQIDMTWFVLHLLVWITTGKNIYFGCAFLCNETSGSFVWLFQTFLKAMGGKTPKTIFTDQAPTIAFAIKEVFPGTCHRLCEWHSDRNAQKNIPQLYFKSGFRYCFDILLWRCNSESEFELIWKKMIDDWDFASNTWLQKLYDLRKNGVLYLAVLLSQQISNRPKEVRAQIESSLKCHARQWV